MIFKSLFTAFCVSTLGLPHALAFVPRDHNSITSIAFANLKQCGLLSPAFNEQSLSLITKANLSLDNYFSISNVTSKWFEYSHFYNPLRPLSYVGPKLTKLRQHSNSAVEEYTERVERLYEDPQGALEISNDQWALLGYILHHIQDASSPLHAVGINHGPGDGFENHFDLTPQQLAEPLDCLQLRKMKASSPLKILKTTALLTLKTVDSPFQYQIDGESQSATWSQKYYSSPELFTDFVSQYLKILNPQNPESALDRFTGFPNQWMQEPLAQGAYGPFEQSTFLGIKSHRFGDSSFVMKNQGARSQINIDQSEFVKFKRSLMLQSIRSTQQLLMWDDMTLHNH